MAPKKRKSPVKKASTKRKKAPRKRRSAPSAQRQGLINGHHRKSFDELPEELKTSAKDFIRPVPTP